MRKMTWVIIIFNVLMFVWVIGGIASTPDGTNDCKREASTNQFLDEEDCDDAAAVGTAIGVGILVFLWAAGDVILGIIWLVTNGGGDRQTKVIAGTMRECPFCKSQIRRDASVCPHCQRESDPWILHEGRWWVKRESGDYFYDEKKNSWTKLES